MSWRFIRLRASWVVTWTGSLSCFDYEFVELLNVLRDELTLLHIGLLPLRVWRRRFCGLAFRHLAYLATKDKTQSPGL